MIRDPFKTFAGTLLLSSTIGLFSISTAQAADCKGLTEAKCTVSDSCAWVGSYKTKAGKTVEAYCRNKASNKQGMEKPKKEKADDKDNMKDDMEKESKKAADKKKTEKKSKSEKKKDKESGADKK